MIDLYISRQRVDFGDNFAILMNHELEDRTNPTVVKNSFSKTVELPGTDNNNKIFGTFFRNDRIQLYGVQDLGAYFDPSKRVPFQLYENGDLVQEGYCKLDKVKKNGEQVLYYVSLYGGLGEFFYNLTYRPDGQEKQLSDLEFGEDLSFKINKETVAAAWENLGTGVNSKWQTINFAPAYNGVPDDFDSKNVIINTKGSSIFTTSKEESGETYTSRDGYILGKLKKSYDEWQMRDLRSYLQRPVIRVKSLFNACFNPVNNSGDTNSGYTVDLDTDFFRSDNPYWEDAWISLPMLNTETEEDVMADPSTTSFSGTSTNKNVTGTTSITITGGDVQTVGNVVDVSDYPFSYVNITADIGLSLTGTNNTGALFLESLDTWQSWVFWTKSRVNASAVMVQLLAYDADTNNLLGGSDIYCFIGPKREQLSNFFYDFTPGDFVGTGTGKYTPVYNASYVPVRGYFLYDSNDRKHYFWSFNDNGDRDFKRWEISISKCPKASRMRFELRVNKAWAAKGDNASGNGWDEMADSLYDGVRLIKSPINLDCTGRGSFILTTPSSVATDSLITQGKLLATEYTPADYLLAYSKMFGLCWFKDKYENKIYCRTRNNFFYPVIEDIDDLIDRSQPFEITPFIFNHKWYSMTQETPETYFGSKYYSDWGREYGQQKINTNYNFDSECEELFNDIPYKNAIMARASSVYFSNYFDYQGHSVPSFFLDGWDGTLFNGDKELDVNYPSNLVNWTTSQEWYGVKNYDWMPKPCFYEYDGEERKPVDIDNVLLFFNGKTSTPGGFWLTDDNSYMITLNDGVCWLYTESAVDEQGNNVAYPINALPTFNRYKLSGNKIIKSWDFGDPKEMYVDNYSLSNDSSVYDQYWRDYLSDQYNVNSRVLVCYVLWNRTVTEELQRRFWWFDNTIWVLNRIIDYDANSHKPTKCEFIRVIDTQNYTKGQITPVTKADTPYDTPPDWPSPNPKPSSKNDPNNGYDPEGDDCPNITFQDVLTKSYAVAAWDRNGDGELSVCEAAVVETLGTVFEGTGIEYFDEIVYFTGINGIEEDAFRDCSNLKHIILPDNIDYIGDNAFNGCSDLEYIKVESIDPPILGEGAFDNTNECPIIINCDYLADFQEQWPQYAYRFQCEGGGEFVLATAITLNVADVTDTGVATYSLSPNDADNYRISWGSSDTSIATIDENGVITAVSNGQVTICVYEEVAGLSDCKTINVTKTPIVQSSIDVSPSSKTVGYESGDTTFNITTINIL